MHGPDCTAFYGSWLTRGVCNAAELLLSAKKRTQRSRSVASAGGDDEAAEALRRLNIEDVTASHAAETRVYTAAAADANVAVALALSPLFRRLRRADSLGSGGGEGASAGGAAAAAAIERAAADEDSDEAPSTPQRPHFLSRCCPSANRRAGGSFSFFLYQASALPRGACSRSAASI